MAPASGNAPTFFVSAGDTSGDHHAAALVNELRTRRPAARFVGFGGAAMRNAGVELLEPIAEEPVMGFAAVLPSIGHFMRLLNGADRWFAKVRPDVVVPVDYPGFNVRLARLARRRGIATAYYICPQYWGWAPWRVRRFEKAVDLALTILPFEAEFLARRGLRARYVGHPLADRKALWSPAADEARRERGPLAILPGSRRREIEQLLGWQLRAARRLEVSLGVAVKRVATHPVASVRERMAEIARSERAELEVSDEPLADLLGRCRAALVTSGTATLECALARVPSVVVYRVNRVGLAASRVLLTSPWITLPNLLAGFEIFPELLRSNDPTDELAYHLLALWNDGTRRERCLQDLDQLRERVLVPGAARRAADAVLEQVRVVSA